MNNELTLEQLKNALDIEMETFDLITKVVKKSSMIMENNNNISFIIISNRDNITTISSVPKESEVIIAREGKRGTAHNLGIKKSTKDWITICDDDISFTPIFLLYINQLKDKNSIITLESYWPSPFGLGRFMFFHRSIYDKIGMFVERSHGFETEWIIRAMGMGYKLIRIPRKSVVHIPHFQSKPKSGDWLNLIWLISKHPFFIFYLIKSVLIKMKYSSDRNEYNSQ